MELFAKGKVGARSVHVFTARGTPEVEAAADDDDTQVNSGGGARNDNEDVPSVRPGRSGMWILAAILLSVLTAMATAFAMKQKDKAANAAVPGVTDPKCLPADPGASGPSGDKTPASRADTPKKKNK
jgi:hypothetical protein